MNAIVAAQFWRLARRRRTHFRASRWHTVAFPLRAHLDVPACA
jgi:hypothetical protein